MHAGRLGKWARSRRGFATLMLALAAIAVAIIGMAALASGPVEPYTTYESTVAGDSPATQYRFDEAAGASTMVDSAGTRTATPTSVTFGGAGPFGGAKAGSFNGTTSIATMPSTPLASATAFTFEG